MKLRFLLKRQKKKYQSYVAVLLILCALYPISKTLIDIKVFLSTGRTIDTQDWVELMHLRKERIALNVPPNEKKILIVSGSNGLFGISAKTISQETGIQTINLSSHAGLGGEYILSRVENVIKKGDIILLPLEYGFYSSSGISNDFKESDVLARFLISYDRSSLQRISVGSLLDFVLSNAFSVGAKKEYISYFKGHLSKKDILERLQQQRVSGGCYSGLTFNEYGDETCTIGKEDAPVDPAVMKTAMSPSMTNIDPGGYIKRFVQAAKAKGAKIIPLYPVSTYTNDYQHPAFQRSAKSIEKFWSNQGIDFQDSLADSFLPPNLMYNTNYHPKDSGRQRRTKSIVDLVRKQLKDIGARP